MPRISTLQLAKNKIERYFDSQTKHVFSINQMKNILCLNNREWSLSSSTSLEKFINFLLEKSYLSIIEFNMVKRYIWRYGNLPNIIYEIALSLKPHSYISHYSAMYLHNLTEQVPKTIYVTYERVSALTKRKEKELTQKKIDEAFQKLRRSSHQEFVCNDYRIILISSPRNDHIGVQPYIFDDNVIIKLTNKERTLIDILVRPEYSGSIYEVLKAYEKSVGIIQINKLKAYLNKLDFIYPYSQCLGFCLEHANFTKEDILAIEEICPKFFSFYLDRQMKDPSYSNRWKLYYPNSL